MPLSNEEALDQLEHIAANPFAPMEWPWSARQADAVAMAYADCFRRIGYRKVNCVAAVLLKDHLYIAFNLEELGSLKNAKREEALASMGVESFLPLVVKNARETALKWKVKESRDAIKQNLRNLKESRFTNMVLSAQEYIRAIESYTERGLAKMGGRKTVAQLEEIKYVTALTGQCHAEMELLEKLHLDFASKQLNYKPTLYFGNTKLACVKCAWYFFQYFEWEGALFRPVYRGAHALAPDGWRVPAIQDLNQALLPGIMEVGRFNNQGQQALVHQDMMDYASDSDAEED
ncbi:hypothetical protein [Corallococcus caeni]|uniref:Uncharacterized protein n=1 Tax=Corallococcus caeni TaxID=3082388 RepID=A0ABQ6QKC4_9BACT|nr:hypothetical protein ASNO1_04080 [Corallococcus sp. NO1]